MAAYQSDMDINAPDIPAQRIGVLPVGGFALMSYASTVEPFRAANLLSGKALYEIVTISHDMAPVASSGAASVTPDVTVDDMVGGRAGDRAALDYLFVVAGGDPTQFDDPRVMAWLGRMARRGVTLGGVSGGPVILARAGLMAGRRMTVHWEHAEALAELLPHLLIERTLYVMDRDRVTCAGGTAALDLMHDLIAQHHGESFAGLISDWFLHTEIRPPIGPQRAGLVARVGSTNPAILDAVRMMEANVAEPRPLQQLAQAAGVSPRQLNRLFQTKLGHSTMTYYRDLRLDKARNLLRNSSLSVTEIALATGFANSSHFSRLFSAHFGQVPSSCRAVRANRPAFKGRP